MEIKFKINQLQNVERGKKVKDPQSGQVTELTNQVTIVRAESEQGTINLQLIDYDKVNELHPGKEIVVTI